MKQTIWKFPLEVADEQMVEMPKNAEILSVQNQKGKAVLYAMVATSNETEKRCIITLGTGHTMPEGFRLVYIGSVSFYDGKIIFHYFEKTTL